MNRGFTLMEILVALMVLAILVVALGGLSSRQLANVSDADRQLDGEWLAENELNRLLAAPDPVTLGREERTVELGEQSFAVVITTSATEAELLRRVEVAVSVIDERDRRHQLISLVGFRGQH